MLILNNCEIKSKNTHGDSEIAQSLYNEKRKKSDANSLNYFLKKTKCYKTAKKLHLNSIKNRCKYLMKSSKESLKYFRPIYDELLKYMDVGNIFIGIENSKEYYLKKDNKIYYYDFTLLSERIIIEFNGKAWHPNWEKYSIEYLVDNFKYTTIGDVKKAVEKDLIKIDLAKKNGFEILTVWEEDGYDFNIKKIKDFLIKNKIKI